MVEAVNGLGWGEALKCLRCGNTMERVTWALGNKDRHYFPDISEIDLKPDTSQDGIEHKAVAFAKDVRQLGGRNVVPNRVILLGCRECGYLERRMMPT